jgi:exodeoxyribonuclease VII small subunit
MTQAKKIEEIDYQALQTELDEIVAELQRDDSDVDSALKHYERGLEIIKQLETYLQTAENTVSQLKARFEK